MAARLLLALALVASSWWVITPGTADACICIRRDVSDLVENSDVILIGKVASVRTGYEKQIIELEDGQTFTRNREFPVYRVEAEQYVSGGGGSVVVVRDVNGPCGSPIEETGGEYVLFLQREERGSLQRRDCSGSFEIRDYTPQSSIDVVEREAALQGKDVTVESFTDDPLPPWTTAASFGAALALGAGLLLGVRRLRAN